MGRCADCIERGLNVFPTVWEALKTVESLVVSNEQFQFFDKRETEADSVCCVYVSGMYGVYTCTHSSNSSLGLPDPF